MAYVCLDMYKAKGEMSFHCLYFILISQRRKSHLLPGKDRCPSSATNLLPKLSSPTYQPPSTQERDSNSQTSQSLVHCFIWPHKHHSPQVAKPSFLQPRKSVVLQLLQPRIPHPHLFLHLKSLQKVPLGSQFLPPRTNPSN